MITQTVWQLFFSGPARFPKTWVHSPWPQQKSRVTGYLCRHQEHVSAPCPAAYNPKFVYHKRWYTLFLRWVLSHLTESIGWHMTGVCSRCLTVRDSTWGEPLPSLDCRICKEPRWGPIPPPLTTLDWFSKGVGQTKKLLQWKHCYGIVPPPSPSLS